MQRDKAARWRLRQLPSSRGEHNEVPVIVCDKRGGQNNLPVTKGSTEERFEFVVGSLWVRCGISSEHLAFGFQTITFKQDSTHSTMNLLY